MKSIFSIGIAIAVLIICGVIVATCSAPTEASSSEPSIVYRSANGYVIKRTVTNMTIIVWAEDDAGNIKSVSCY